MPAHRVLADGRARQGGTVTQATSKATGVTINAESGQITMNNAALNAGVEVTFTVTNSFVKSTDVVAINVGSGAASSASYLVGIGAVANGSFDVVVSNASAGNLSEAIVLNFTILGASTAAV